MVKTIELVNGIVKMLDQTKLPREVVYVDCKDYLMVAKGIKDLWIRGAPAIGIAASMGIAIGAQDIKADNFYEFMKDLESVFTTLLETRPTAVNIQWAVERTKKLLSAKKDDSIDSLKAFLIEEANRVLASDIEINKTIGKWGSQFIKDGDTVITHCNAGSLATGGYGTATGPIRVAVEQGKNIHVYADETRPVLQGCRLTAWELMEDNIPVTLITDNAAGAILRKGEINLAIVGTDRTVANGDVANKPLSSIDFSMPTGDLIPIEERGAEEVTHVSGCQIAPEGVKVRNIAFDVTPAKYVTGIITEKGVFRPEDLHKVNAPGADLESIMMKAGDE
jgi:methylthioribose-1-phosphate isomerase